ncbi:DUF2726 domain-containing protein [Peribacillus frigoritolerans]|uniref:DUF2726 domain-containing protein n=1 Tax=Peribacillus frigoritolerans TaxID=450367 RepID=UPI0025A274A7|nr:DUF2726 domain-containing protein [Peribacillus frigoritolerans]MDM5305814.1 DUF2726 domain-containing protein [Peribacillus frigoritolerans]
MALRKIMNRSEEITYEAVKEICEKYKARVFPKVNLNDVFELKKSELPYDLFNYGQRAHFDLLVCNELGYPLFVVEFDGPYHKHDENTIVRDQKKNALCEINNLPILRVTNEHFDEQATNMNLLTWFIEVWFALEWFQKAQKDGKYIDESFSPWSLITLPKREEKFPLWLSINTRAKIQKLHQQNLIEDMVPSCSVWTKNWEEFICIAWVKIDRNSAVMVESRMQSQNFPAPIHDLIEDLTINQLYKKLLTVINGDGNQAVFPGIINLRISEMNQVYVHPISGGGQCEYQN